MKYEYVKYWDMTPQQRLQVFRLAKKLGYIVSKWEFVQRKPMAAINNGLLYGIAEQL